MAIVIDNIYTKGISGRVGNTLLYKHYGHKTVVTAFPRLTNIAPSARQRAQRKKFALAVLKTKQWLTDQAKKRFLTGLKLKWNSLSAYHAGIRYHMTQTETNTLPTQSGPAAGSPTNTSTTGVTTPQQKPVKGNQQKPLQPSKPER